MESNKTGIDDRAEFEKFFRDARSRIIIVGINPIAEQLEMSAAFFADLLTVKRDVTLTILYESDIENFNQAICMDTPFARGSSSNATLALRRRRISGTSSGRGLLREICDNVEDVPHRPDVERRITIRQCNVRLPLNLIIADKKLWFAVSTQTLPTLGTYHRVDETHPLYNELASFVEFYLDPHGGRPFLSTPDDELIWVYDHDGLPRGIFPRGSFYTTEYRRYSVWGFVFNRRGELLLHRRSEATKDNRGLWDKSIGGHVAVGDSSTSITAKRELIEEMFLPEAEFTKYLRADLGDIIDFGELNTSKRPERYFREAFSALGASDWIMFRATDSEGTPLTITRVSNRRLHESDGQVRVERTVFMSDVYTFIAPAEYMDTEEQMKSLVALAEKKGPAIEHRLVTVNELRRWIEDAEAKSEHLETFTDDLLFMNVERRAILEVFSEFVKYVFR